MTAESTNSKPDTAAIRKYYDSVAEDGGYTDIYSLPVCNAEDVILARLLSQDQGRKKLDIGCGDCLYLKICNLSDSSYVGVDVSQGLLRNAKSANPEQLFINSDMQNLPFAKGEFDSLVSMYGPFSYSLTPEELIEEFRRVLKPGSTLYVMPYTLRTGAGIELGGLSTAVEPSIQKIFYTSEMARSVFSKTEIVKIVGLNYFVNPLSRMLNEQEITLDELNAETFTSLLNSWAAQMGIPLPNLDCAIFSDLCEKWKEIAQGKLELSSEDLENLLQAEDKISHIVPAEFARHMFIEARVQ